MGFRDSWKRRFGGGAQAKAGRVVGAPTMIIPGGTQIHVDTHGQLSIRTPGNLVIQNSGSYAVLESVSGSIRIEPGVEVEAVRVRCANTCYIQGSLVAWQLVARTLHLDGEARAHVVMQETKHLEVGRHARLVGNFQSERELFQLFSRFSREVQALPFPLQDGSSSLDAVEAELVEEEPGAAAGDPEPSPGEELPEDLFFALVLLERELAQATYSPAAKRILRELINLLRERDLETLRHTHRTLLARVKQPREELQRARRLLESYFSRVAPTRADADASGDSE